MIKKVLAASAVAFLTVGLAACSSGDASENRQADISKPVTTVDEAWEQLDELNYAFSKVGDAEWVETASPTIMQCSSDEEQIQIYTGRKGVFSEKLNHEEIAEDISKILDRSGLETSIETDTLTGGETKLGIATVYATNDENINLTVAVDATGYIDLASYSKCVPGSVDTQWTAPGRAPILKNDKADEDDEAAEETPAEETPAEQTPTEETTEEG